MSPIICVTRVLNNHNIGQKSIISLVKSRLDKNMSTFDHEKH